MQESLYVRLAVEREKINVDVPSSQRYPVFFYEKSQYYELTSHILLWTKIGLTAGNHG